ncbi:hypothetical protein QTP86_005073 [Hemibagrus guttatus]|nr:hypothetical protein QTP86_005073 [Hemibagrus guttatus]
MQESREFSAIVVTTEYIPLDANANIEELHAAIISSSGGEMLLRSGQDELVGWREISRPMLLLFGLQPCTEGGIGGSVVGCLPVMRKARVRFPANTSTPATGYSAGPKPGKNDKGDHITPALSVILQTLEKPFLFSPTLISAHGTHANENQMFQMEGTGREETEARDRVLRHAVKIDAGWLHGTSVSSSSSPSSPSSSSSSSPMYSFLILSNLVTPKENLNIFSSATSSSDSCLFLSDTVSKPYSMAGLTTVLYTFPLILADIFLPNSRHLSPPIPTCLHSLLHLFPTVSITLDC